MPFIHGAFLGCADSRAKVPEPASDRTVVTVRLLAEPAPEFREINLHLNRVVLASRMGHDWQTLSLPDRPWDLQHADSPQPLTGAVTLDRRDYRYLGLHADPERSSVTLADGSTRPLELPHLLHTGIRVTLAPGERSERDIVLVADTARSIQRVRDGSGKDVRFVFHPLLLAVDADRSGRITGRITDPEGTPLKGIIVSAQARTNSCAARPRAVRTGPGGRFELDWVGWGWNRFHVVLSPGPAGPAAQASAELPFGPGVATFHLGLLRAAPAAEPGILAGTVLEPAGTDQHDEVMVFQRLAMGAGAAAPWSFLLRCQPVDLSVDDRAGRFEFILPAGDYQVRVDRVTLHADGRTTRQAGAKQPCTVPPRGRVELRL